jgi:hypothetical protein
VADVHLHGPASLSDRAQDILRRADQPAAANGHARDADAADRELLDILQEAIDQTRDHLEAIRDLLEQIAGERLTPHR